MAQTFLELSVDDRRYTAASNEGLARPQLTILTCMQEQRATRRPSDQIANVIRNLTLWILLCEDLYHCAVAVQARWNLELPTVQEILRLADLKIRACLP